ncbi:hypothetical protein GORBP_040_00130 [Gordonia rubripertincta NBRC 101908]|uniref:Uncharacterized protein n=1 Tax=Gordonia rubripertincta NBRC 101908 TaxID=1077975 RepID=A0ABQ0HQK7_GORRU|nr:hypothetical protein GORBP_040_00130 [Gordonia rubripertincta NBRC 101908]
MQGDVAEGVSGGRHHLGPSREFGVVVEGGHLGLVDSTDLEGPGKSHAAEQFPGRGVAQRNPESGGVLVRVSIGMRGEPCIVTMDVYGDAPVSGQASRGAHVIEVPMGDDQRGHRVDVVAQVMDRIDQRSVRAGQPSVDDHESVVDLDQILVGVRVFEAMDSGCDVALEDHASA